MFINRCTASHRPQKRQANSSMYYICLDVHKGKISYCV